MPNSDKSDKDNDNEAILLTLDQLSQTLDTMKTVIARLRHQVADQPVRDIRDKPYPTPTSVH